MITKVSNSTRFGEIWQANERFSREQNVLFCDINDKLRDKNYKYDFDNQTPMNWLEKKGYDVFVESGDNDKSVNVSLIDKLQYSLQDVNYRCKVGEYDSNNKFNVEDVKNARKNEVAATATTLLVSFIVVAGFLFNTISKCAGNSVNKISSKQKTNIVENLPKKLLNNVIEPFKNRI